MAFLTGDMDPPAAQRNIEAWLLWALEVYAAVVVGLLGGVGVGLVLAEQRGLL